VNHDSYRDRSDQRSESLKTALQDAIRVELFTVPPYLTHYITDRLSARRSVCPQDHSKLCPQRDAAHESRVQYSQRNRRRADDQPARHDPFLSKPAAMAIAGGVEVHLKRYSHALVKTVFMAIEEPELPLDLPIKTHLLADESPAPRTIGDSEKKPTTWRPACQ